MCVRKGGRRGKVKKGRDDESNVNGNGCSKIGKKRREKGASDKTVKMQERRSRRYSAKEL